MKTPRTAAATTDCRELPWLLPDLGSRKVAANFFRGEPFPALADAGLGVTAAAQCFGDQRQQVYVDHPVPQWQARRIYGWASGYDDLNDHAHRRLDPLWAAACEQADPLGRGPVQAGPSGRVCWKWGMRCCPSRPKRSWWIWRPWANWCMESRKGGISTLTTATIVICHSTLLPATFRCGRSGAPVTRTRPRRGVPLEKIVAAIRKRCRQARIMVRGDSGFYRKEVLA